MVNVMGTDYSLSATAVTALALHKYSIFLPYTEREAL
jgi:hypothetical protein